METGSSFYRIELDVPFEQALERAIHELGVQGLGVVTWIDMKDKLAERLGADFRAYVIMGVFDPEVAQSGLDAKLEAGLVLTSTVVVYEISPRSSVIAALAPIHSYSAFDDVPQMQKLARDTDERIQAALQSLEAP